MPGALDSEISRRSFLKAAAVGAVGTVGAIGAIGASAVPQRLPGLDAAPLPADPNAWIEGEIARSVLDPRVNRLADFGGQAVFDKPVVRVADGDDELFKELKQAVNLKHLMPRDVLQRYGTPAGDIQRVRVISWALPMTAPVRDSNHAQGWPSDLFHAASARGGAINFRLERMLTDALLSQGWRVVVPETTQAYAVSGDPVHVISSTWSDRHVAYIAGMGQFGLRGCLITPAGVNVHMGSLVTDGPFAPTPRAYEGYAAPCLLNHGEACGACMRKCPEGAITRDGLDKPKCLARLRACGQHFAQGNAGGAKEQAAAAGTRKQDEPHAACGKCMVGVPCEACTPAAPPDAVAS